MLPFQDLSRRKRKDVRVEDITVKVHLFAFDCLFLNGEVRAVPSPDTWLICGQSLLHQDLEHRRELLRKHFVEVPNEFAFATWSDADTVDDIQVFLDDAIKAGTEGLMVKRLVGEEAYYTPSQRSQSWLKVRFERLQRAGSRCDRSRRTTWPARATASTCSASVATSARARCVVPSQATLS
jgi:DNA ligase-1